MIYYKTLKKLFEESGYTYNELQELIGVHAITLIRLANADHCNKYNISLKVLDKLCAFFKIQPGKLLEYRKG